MLTDQIKANTIEDKQPPSLEIIPQDIHASLVEFTEFINESSIHQSAKKLAVELSSRLCSSVEYSIMWIKEILHRIGAYLEEGTYLFNWMNAILATIPDEA